MTRLRAKLLKKKSIEPVAGYDDLLIDVVSIASSAGRSAALGCEGIA